MGPMNMPLVKRQFKRTLLDESEIEVSRMNQARMRYIESRILKGTLCLSRIGGCTL